LEILTIERDRDLIKFYAMQTVLNDTNRFGKTRFPKTEFLSTELYEQMYLLWFEEMIAMLKRDSKESITGEKK
jgi:hypothetical protein